MCSSRFPVSERQIVLVRLYREFDLLEDLEKHIWNFGGLFRGNAAVSL